MLPVVDRDPLTATAPLCASTSDGVVMVMSPDALIEPETPTTPDCVSATVHDRLPVVETAPETATFPVWTSSSAAVVASPNEYGHSAIGEANPPDAAGTPSINRRDVPSSRRSRSAPFSRRMRSATSVIRLDVDLCHFQVVSRSHGSVPHFRLERHASVHCRKVSRVAGVEH